MFTSKKKQEILTQKYSLREGIIFFKDALTEYLSARKELFQIEAREVSSFLFKKVVLFVCLLFLLSFSYLLFWLVCISALANVLEHLLKETAAWLHIIGFWPLIALCVLVFHCAVIFHLIKYLRVAADFTMFEITRSELQKDKQWIEEIK